MQSLDEGARPEFLIVAQDQEPAQRLAEMLRGIAAALSHAPIVSIALGSSRVLAVGKADVVFVSATETDADWVNVIRRLVADAAATPVVAVIPHHNDALAAEAMAAGASGCITLDPADHEHLRSTIDCALALRRAGAEHERAQAGLRAEVERYSTALAAVPLILLTVDPDLRCTWIGRTRVRLDDDLVGKRLSESRRLTRTDALDRLLRDVMASGIDAQRDVRLVIDGVPRELDTVVSVIHPPGGGTAGLTIAAFDETDARSAAGLAERQATMLSVIERLGQIGTWTWDVAAQQAQWSEGMFRLVGLTPDRPVPTMDEFLALIHEEDREKVRRAYESVIATPHAHVDEVTYRVRTSRGRTRTLRSSRHVVLYSEGATPAVIMGVVQDLTEREDVDRALRESEEMFRNAMAYAPIGMGVVGADGRWRQVNRAFCEMLGYTEHEMLQRTYRDVTHPDDLAFDSAQLEQLFAGQISSYELEKRYLHKRGHVVWGLMTRTAIHDANGTTVYAVSQVQDISDRRRTRDSAEFIAESGHVLASSLESVEIVRTIAHLAVPRLADWCTIDLLDPATSEVHTAEVVAVSSEKEEMLRASRGRYPLSPFAFDHPVSRVIRTGQAALVPQVRSDMLTRLARDADHLQMLRRLAPVSWMIVPLAARGRIIGAISLVSGESGRHYTLDDLRLAEELATSSALAIDNARLFEDARAASRLRDDVLSFVTHDLRNPLGAIVRWSTRLDESATTGDERRRATAAIREAADVMNELITDLMDLTRLESGHLRIEPEPVRAEYFLAGIRDMFEPAAQAKGIELRVEHGELPRVHADPQRIHQVLSNLVGNSMRFVPAGGRITVHAQVQHDDVVFAVTDNGPGIAPEDVPRVFERFWQAAHARKTGAGLGLAIARGIIEAHKGRIWVESELRHGSTFYFTLPIWHGAVSNNEPTDVETHRIPVPTETLRVLVVEDHPLTRSGLVQLLNSQAGIAVVGEASTGEQAVELVPKLHPDVVIMDLSMPGIGGVEATRRIVAAAGDAVVLVLTADEAPATLADALRAGARGYLRKTINEGELVTSLRAVARGEVLIDPSLKEFLRSGLRAPAEDEAAAGLRELSQRERKVLALSAQGYTAAQAGEKLFLSPKTVETYRSRAMRKLGLETRADLVAFAMRAGLLTS